MLRGVWRYNVAKVIHISVKRAPSKSSIFFLVYHKKQTRAQETRHYLRCVS